MTQEKTKVGKFLQGAVKHLRFGAVELAKGAAPVGFVLNMIEKATGKDLATGEVKDITWLKIVWKGLGLIVVLYLLHKQLVDVQIVLDFLNALR